MMKPISVWKQELAGGTHTARLASLYCCSPEQTAAHAARYAAVLDGLEATFGAHTEAGLYSAPGRTEIGGNHTDHQHGRVLAGSVNIDMIAAAAPNDKNQLRVQSEGYDLCVIDLNDLEARKEEENTTAALLRGECAAFTQRGAKLAGLEELPCVVVEMSEREQLSTMLTENMQRSDLTVYEQAQGFQMMMDFGQTVEQISDKSGFSQSTIRRRIKLLELNRDSFKKAEKRGATLSDFAQLDKIEDLEARNRVLETLGTQNFNRAMQDALEQQKWQHQKAEWVEQLKKFATEDSQASYQTHEHVNAYGKWGTKKEVVMPEDADKIAYVYKVSENQIDLYKPRDTEAEDASNSAREAARATEQLAREQFAAVTKLMYELRWDFVKDLTPAECKKHLPEILAYSTPILTEYRHMEDDENVLRLLGIGLDEQIREDTELEDALKMFNAYDTEPEKILLAVAFDATDGSREGYWSTEWNGPTGASKFVHRKNDDLDSTYELLTVLGYEMADDEKALQDGTHQLFAVYGSGSKADTPCDKCKAAHPECDKCCKTCDDHCNAFQLCRKEYGE